MDFGTHACVGALVGRAIAPSDAEREEVLAFYNTLENAAPRKAAEKLLVPLNLDERELADLLEFLGTLSSPGLAPELTTAPPTPYLEEEAQ